jgi:hypothetical protein
MWSAATEAAAALWFLCSTQMASAPTPALGRLSLRLETEVEPVKNPVERTATVAEMLRRPAASAKPQVVGAVSAEPLVFGAAPFSMATGPERILGDDQPKQEVDELIDRITAMKAFLKPK